MTYFLDTNIISYLLANDTEILNRLLSIIDDGGTIKIPVVSYYEIKRGIAKSSTAKDKIPRFETLLRRFEIEEMTVETFSIAAKIYESLSDKGQIIEDDDIFIGATALEQDAILVTNNEKHLRRIEGLKLEVWN